MEIMGSESFDNGLLVEVTLQSLSGILLSAKGADGDVQVPNMTAAVAFSGSAKNMEVASSFICPKTGNLMVESFEATMATQGDGEQRHHHSLIARWNEGGDNAQDVVPHLSIRVPNNDSHAPKMPLSKTNRDSFIVRDNNTSPMPPGKDGAPSLDESDCSSSVAGTHDSKQTIETEEEEELCQGPSIVWSASSAAMPEIIELHVSIKLDADDNNSTSSSPIWKETVFEVGISHLVFLGTDEGTTIMDLPVKMHPPNQSFLDGQISVDDNASLRIKVDVRPTEDSHSSSRERLHPDYINTQHQAIREKAVLEPILQQLRDAEERIANNRKHQKTKNLTSPLLCDIGMLDIFATFQEALQCENAPPKAMFIHRRDSMGASTILTAPSLEI